MEKKSLKERSEDLVKETMDEIHDFGPLTKMDFLIRIVLELRIEIAWIKKYMEASDD